MPIVSVWDATGEQEEFVKKHDVLHTINGKIVGREVND
jgi:hypothetical protein